MSNATSFTTDPLNIWLLSNDWMAPFVVFDSPNDVNDTETRRTTLKNTIDKIKFFKETMMIHIEPQLPCFPMLAQSMTANAAFLAHKHFFLQDKLYRTRCKSYKNSLNRVDNVINVLEEAMKIESAMIVLIDVESLFRFLLAESKKSAAISEIDSTIVSQISTDELLISDSLSQLNALIHIITGMKPQYDRKSLFLYEHPLQEKFDQLFFHQDYEFRNEVDQLFTDEFMSSSKIFSVASVKLMQKLTNVYQLNDSTEVSIFSLIFFRAVYSHIANINMDFLFPKIECKFHLYADLLTVQHTGASPNFLPKHDEKESLKEIVAKSDKLEKASRILTGLSFHISPLDLLAEIHLALTELRMFVCETPANEDAQSFDTIFGLFLVVLISSDLPDLEQVFKFILDFSPTDGLTGPLEYARATVSAASLQCKSILQNVIVEQNST